MNFQRKAFFNASNKWAKRKYDDGKGSLLVRSGALRRSISSTINGDRLEYSSNVPYAAIHNEGGEITVTEKMKRSFWFKYLEIEGNNTEKEGRTKLESRYGYKKDGSNFQEQGLAYLDLLDEVNRVLHQFSGEGFSSFSCVKSVTNHNHHGIISNEHKAGR